MLSERVNPTGPYVDLSLLMALRFAAPELGHAPRRIAAGQPGAGYQPRLRGRGLDCVEVRPYQAGDDIRTIDWRVTARSTAVHTRLYAEERERPVLLVCDQRQHMFFGTRTRFKSVQAAALASLLGWSAHRHGDRVGGVVLGNDAMLATRAGASSRHVLQLLKYIEDCNRALQPEGPSTATASMTDALQELRRTVHPGSAVFIISDCPDLDGGALGLLGQLGRHCDLNLLRVYDPLETELPPRGYFRVTDGRDTVGVNTARRTVRQRYHDAFEQQTHFLLSACSRQGVGYVDISTAEDPIDFVAGYLSRGGKGRR